MDVYKKEGGSKLYEESKNTKWYLTPEHQRKIMEVSLQESDFGVDLKQIQDMQQNIYYYHEQ